MTEIIDWSTLFNSCAIQAELLYIETGLCITLKPSKNNCSLLLKYEYQDVLEPRVYHQGEAISFLGEASKWREMEYPNHPIVIVNIFIVFFG